MRHKKGSLCTSKVPSLVGTSEESRVLWYSFVCCAFFVLTRAIISQKIAYTEKERSPPNSFK